MPRAALIHKEYIQETVRETLLQIGFNISSPDDVLEYRKDLYFLREKRVRSEVIRKHILITVVSVVTASILAFIGSAWLFMTNYRGD